MNGPGQREGNVELRVTPRGEGEGGRLGGGIGTSNIITLFSVWFA